MNGSGAPIEWQSKMTINGTDVSDLTLAVESKSGLDDKTMTINSSMQAVLDGSNSRLKTVDLRGRVVLSFVSPGSEVRQFSGYVIATNSKGTEYTIQCNDNSQILEEATMGGGFGDGLLPVEMLYYLVANTMPEATNPKNFPVSTGKSLADCDWLLQSRKYTFVAPLPACSLTSGGVKLAKAYLYTTEQGGSVDDFNIAARLPEQIPFEWKSGGTRVRIEVEAKGMLDAFEKGRERLRKMLDYLSFGMNFSTPGYEWQTQNQLFQYERKRILTDVRETSWAYVGDSLSSNRYWLQWTPPHLKGGATKVKADDSLLGLYRVFQSLLEREDEELNSAQRSIMNACHALRQVRQAENVRDALDHVFRCMEYLLKGYKVRAMFSEQDISAVLKTIRESQSERDKNLPESERVMRGNRLKSLLKTVNQVPLRTTWYHFCSEHKLDFPEQDQEFLWKLRAERNENQHGRMARVKRGDIHRAASMMEKAIVAAASHAQQQPDKASPVEGVV